MPNRLPVCTTPGVPGEFSVSVAYGAEMFDFPIRRIWALPAVDHRADVLPGHTDDHGATIPESQRLTEPIAGLDGAGDPGTVLGEGEPIDQLDPGVLQDGDAAGVRGRADILTRRADRDQSLIPEGQGIPGVVGEAEAEGVAGLGLAGDPVVSWVISRDGPRTAVFELIQVANTEPAPA